MRTVKKVVNALMIRPVMRVSERVRSFPNMTAGEADLENIRQRRALQWWTVALILLCLGTLWLEFRHIETTMPYPRHGDEAYITGPARRTLLTGTLHPETFVYPSLPKYVAAGGMAVGFLRGASHLEIRELRHVGNVGYPYYETRRVMQTARQVFVVLSVMALAATGVSAWLAFGEPAAILLAPLILLASPLFFFHSWTYLNVDIVGTSLVMLTIAGCLQGMRRSSIFQSAIAPAALAGLATGSKYTLALVGLPVLSGIGLYLTGSRRIRAWAIALGTLVGAFLVAVPYSVIDIPLFLDGVASEAFHYASGHRGYNGEPGLSQLLYYGRHFASEFGVIGVMLAVLGFAVYAVADWRRATVLASFPVATLWLLSIQVVHFPRNVLSLHPLVAMFAAFGLIFLYRWALRRATRRGWVSQPIKRRIRVLFGLALVIATVPLWHLAGHLRDRTDSRNLAHEWIDENLSLDWTIVIPRELAFDSRALEASGRRVVVIDVRPAQDPGAFATLTGEVPSPAVIMVPRWGADSRYPGQEIADTLNELSRRWRAIETFGTNDVLVNYSYTTPWGDPAFSIAVLR